jgi:putative glutamine amidotransferase
MATALAPDDIIEGAEIPGHPYAVAVQWHPENLIADDPSMLSLFRGLVVAASQ